MDTFVKFGLLLILVSGHTGLSVNPNVDKISLTEISPTRRRYEDDDLDWYFLRRLKCSTHYVDEQVDYIVCIQKYLCTLWNDLAWEFEFARFEMLFNNVSSFTKMSLTKMSLNEMSSSNKLINHGQLELMRQSRGWIVEG